MLATVSFAGQTLTFKQLIETRHANYTAVGATPTAGTAFLAFTTKNSALTYAFVLSAMAGHLFGYEAALAIDLDIGATRGGRLRN